jgi:hypothetical protein
MKLSFAAFAMAALAVAALTVPALAQTSTGFSGYELFAGVSRKIKPRNITCKYMGNAITSFTAHRSTKGATFFGWTNTSASPPAWVPPFSSTGGLVDGSVNYVGTPGFGNGQQDNYVCLTGGIWSWVQSDQAYHGKVINGYVEWPSDATTSVDSCPSGVAALAAYVSVNGGSTGQISGCLNDQLAFPPHIWGTVSLQ